MPSGKVFNTSPQEECILEKARELRAMERQWSWARISIMFGRSEDWFKRRLVPGYLDMRRKSIAAHQEAKALGINNRRAYRREGPIVISVRSDIVDRLRSEIPHDTRTLTGRLCGDPLPGRSALDRKAQA